MQLCVFTKTPFCTHMNKELNYPSSNVPPRNITSNENHWDA